MFDGFALPARQSIKLVGFTIDSKFRWGPMIDRLVQKARSRIGALSRIRCFLDSTSMKMMYSMFVRSILEYGSVAWMGAAQTHLDKLDRVQLSAQRIGGFEIESLESRRAAAAISFSLKILAGQCKGMLNSFTPTLFVPSSLRMRHSRHALIGIQVKSVVKSHSLDVYRRGFLGVLPSLWSSLPHQPIAKGDLRGWLKIKERC